MERYHKAFNAKESQLILKLRKEGHTYEDIGRITGRSLSSIRGFLYRETKDNYFSKKFILEKTLEPAAETKQQEPSPKVSLMVGGVKVGEAKAEAVISSNEPVSIVRSKELQPREMIKKLYDMGYRIENNQLVCYQKVVVKVNDIINGQ